MNFLCWSFVLDATRNVLHKTSEVKLNILGTILKQLKSCVDMYLYSQGMFPCHYICKGIFSIAKLHFFAGNSQCPSPIHSITVLGAT